MIFLPDVHDGFDGAGFFQPRSPGKQVSEVKSASASGDDNTMFHFHLPYDVVLQ